MPNFSSLARLEVPEKFLWVVVGGVCQVIFMSNPTVVLRLGWGFDNKVTKRQSDFITSVERLKVSIQNIVDWIRDKD